MKSLIQFYKKSAIVDNNILIDLYELERLDLLFSVFDKVGFPRIIFQEETPEEIIEILDECNYNYVLCDIETEEGYVAYKTLTDNYKGLSTHDKVAISIAKEFKYYCNSNDGLVRKACRNLNVECVGTLGIVGCAFKKGIISQSEFLQIIGLLLSDSTSCHLSKKLVDEFLEKLNISLE